MKTKDELTERAKGLLRLKGFKGVESEFWMTAISDVMADFAAQETASLTRDLAEANARVEEYKALISRTDGISGLDADKGRWIVELSNGGKWRLTVASEGIHQAEIPSPLEVLKVIAPDAALTAAS
jgi:hypothetical protein